MNLKTVISPPPSPKAGWFGGDVHSIRGECSCKLGTVWNNEELSCDVVELLDYADCVDCVDHSYRNGGRTINLRGPIVLPGCLFLFLFLFCCCKK